MYFKQFLDEICGCASYLIASRQSREAAVVDPSVTTEQYETLLADRGFTLRYVIDTHVHADHVSGARGLAARYGAPVCLHASARVTYPFRGLTDGEELALGQLRLRVVHTPGHRPELISLLVINPPRSAEPSMVLTGDCLLVGDVGRPDFGGGDADAQYASVHRVLQLPDWVAVFPGHFEGPCGKGMCGRPSTTVGFERLYNPLARLERPAFLREMTDSVPARPLNMAAIEATNRGLLAAPWAMLTSTPPVEDAGLEVLDSRPPDAVLIDVREPSEYAAGHIPGATNVPQAELATRLDDAPRDRPVYLVCRSGARSLRAAQFLRQLGYPRVANVRGGTLAWRASGRPVEVSANVGPAPHIIESEWMHGGAAPR
jgi:glyoxylase-like metal-dependent hydrolase (beta-lactamase superfamily II)/rhodanese-related sulfurtransferase